MEEFKTTANETHLTAMTSLHCDSQAGTGFAVSRRIRAALLDVIDIRFKDDPVNRGAL